MKAIGFLVQGFVLGIIGCLTLVGMLTIGILVQRGL